MLKPALQLRLGQQLTMTPQLQQRIAAASCCCSEPVGLVVQLALESNVMLEVEEEESQELTPLEQQQTVDQAPDADGGPREEEVSVEMVDPWDDTSTPAGEKRTNDDDDRPLEFADEAERDLHQHLIWHSSDQPSTRAGLDRRGDHRRAQRRRLSHRKSRRHPGEPDHRSARHAGRGRAGSAYVQTFDPAGIGAQRLRSCLQLAARARNSGRIRQFAQDHLQDVADRDVATPPRALDVDEEALEAMALIQGLPARSGSAFQSSQPEYIVPTYS